MSVRHYHRRITSTVLAMRTTHGSSSIGHTPTFTLETITPEKAAQLLGTMASNRRLRQKVVQRYAREMIAGKWQVNGEAIKVSDAGRLIDGQHRLNAVMMAKIPVTMYVVRGVDASTMVTLDTGVNRTFEDVGILKGRSFGNCGPIARWWFRYDAGSPASTKTSATNQELEAIVDLHPTIEESASFIHRHKILRTKCVPGVQGFVHAYASEKHDREMADLFMLDLNDGASLAKTSPIYHLRKRLVDDSNARHRSLPSWHALALTIKAWNLWLEGAKVGALRWQTSEEYPRFSIDTKKKTTKRIVA